MSTKHTNICTHKIIIIIISNPYNANRQTNFHTIINNLWILQQQHDVREWTESVLYVPKIQARQKRIKSIKIVYLCQFFHIFLVIFFCPQKWFLASMQEFFHFPLPHAFLAGKKLFIKWEEKSEMDDKNLNLNYYVKY